MNIVPDLYDKTNQLQVKDGLSLLQQVKQFIDDTADSDSGGRVVKSVLDVGCGTGNITRLICKFISCESIVGMDLSEAMVTYAKSNYQEKGMTYVTADILSELNTLCKTLQVSPGSIDLVVSIHCLHWIPEPLHTQAMSNIRALMSPGSTCFLVFFSWTDLLPIQEQIILHPRWRKYFKEVLESDVQDSNSNKLTPEKSTGSDRARRKSSAPFLTMETVPIAERINVWKRRLTQLSFEPITVKVERVSFTFQDWPAFAAEAKSICHYMKYIPEEEKESFLDAYYELVKANSNMRDGKAIVDSEPVTLDYENILVIAKKPEHE